MHQQIRFMKHSDFLKGTLSTLILSLLKENGKMYGYQICQKTKELSNSSIILTEGAIYPALHKLEKSGLIVSSKEMYNGRTRKYYSICMQQRNMVSTQISDLAEFLNIIHKIIAPSKI